MVAVSGASYLYLSERDRVDGSNVLATGRFKVSPPVTVSDCVLFDRVVFVELFVEFVVELL